MLFKNRPLLLLFFISNISLLPANSINFFEVDKIVASNSTAVRVKQLDLEIRKIMVGSQLLAYLPGLNINFDLNSRPFCNGALTDNLGWNSKWGISASWNIVENADRFLNHKIDRLEYKNMLQEYRETYQTELQKALKQYITVLKNKSLFQTMESNFTLTEFEFESIKTQYRQGEKSRLDLLQAESDFYNAKYSLENQRITYQTALIDLEKILLQKIESLTPIAHTNTEPIDEEQQFAEFLKQKEFRPMQVYSNRLKQDRLRTIIAFKDRFLPNISLNANADLLQGSISHDSPHAITRPEATIGLSVSYPIFEQNTLLNKYRTAKRNKKKTQLLTAAAYENLFYSFIQLVRNHNLKTTLIEASYKKFTSAKSAFAAAQEGYKLGVYSILELIRAREQYEEAEREYNFLFYDILSLRVELGASYFGDAYLFVKKQ